jgi:molecular chaperone Hsp33
VEDTLMTLGQAELQDVLRTEGKIEVDCEFCQQRYSLGAADVARLFTVDPDATVPPPGTVLH